MSAIELLPVPKGSIELSAVNGIPGPAGRDAVGGDLTMIAASEIGGHRMVSTNDEGRAELTVNSVSSLLRMAGLTLQAVSSGGSVLVRRNGPIEENSWSWEAGSRLYLGSNGTLTQTPPSSGPIIILGVALSPTRIMLSPQTLVERS